MSDRRLVVAELDPADADHGKLFGLSANVASAIRVPAFQFGTAKPAVGSEIGEAFYETTSRKGWVWNGTAWLEIAATPLKTFPTETGLQASTAEPVGTYAIALDSGGLFVKRTGGWVYVGVKPYNTAAALLADTQGVGTLGEALDENSLWERTSSGWRLLVVREMADTAAIMAWGGTAAGASTGDRAVDLAHDVSYIRTAGGWRPITLWEETEANIRAATWVIDGQEAIATDTGRTFVRVSGAWVEEPIQHYATEAALLAVNAQNGVLAWADNTNVVFIRAAGVWKRLQGPQISYGATAPATPATGDLWHDSTPTTGKGLQIWGAGAWHTAAPPASGFGVGSVQQTILTEAQWATAMGADAANWVLADGRAVPGTKYATITGQANVPDLRGAFIRAAGTATTGGRSWAGGAPGSVHGYSTARPANDFVVDSQGLHHHSYSDPLTRNTSASGNPGIKGDPALGAGEAVLHPGTGDTTTAGGHTHTVTGGGDAETAPVHISLNTFIRVG